MHFNIAGNLNEACLFCATQLHNSMAYMNLFQRILKAFYPWRMKLSERTGLGKQASLNKQDAAPPVSFYQLQATAANGKPFAFESLRGKYVLLVNTASNCGYTGQYADLQQLYNLHKGKLEILGFPANDFAGQEPGSDESISQFCQVNFGVSFPLMRKAGVKGANRQAVYQWLTSPGQNGWNSQTPSWNFCKYLVTPDGCLEGFYSSAVSPLSEEIAGKLAY
jgi:glutathione peroxidase